jgi:arylsulfatase A-like enzyme
MISSIDFFPTLLRAAGLRPQAGQQFDGISIVPALRGRRLKRDTLFCHFPHYIPLTENVPGTWVRKGDWKLIRRYCDNEDQSDRFELYHLKNDLGEKNNLAAAEPARVKQLAGLIEEHLRNIDAVVPKPNPKYRRMEDQKK